MMQETQKRQVKNERAALVQHLTKYRKQIKSKN